jgi:hypothetical protein
MLVKRGNPFFLEETVRTLERPEHWRGSAARTGWYGR